MACPETVPTIIIKGCNRDLGMIVLDGFKTSTAKTIPCFGEDSVKEEQESISLGISITRDVMIGEMFRWYKDVIDNGSAPFATYVQHRGQMEWWVVKIKTHPLSFSKSPGVWKARIDVEVIGYARTATEPEAPSRLVSDDGSLIVDDNGNYITSDALHGTASNIICI